MIPRLISADRWLDTQDRELRKQRLARVKWVKQLIPSASFRVFPGGWMAKVLLDEASYCFIYGQFVATVTLAFAFIERTLAGRLFNAGWKRARKANIPELILKAVEKDWLTTADKDHIEQARSKRNPMIHYREHLESDTIEARSLNEAQSPYAILESDASHVLEIAYRLFRQNQA